MHAEVRDADKAHHSPYSLHQLVGRTFLLIMSSVGCKAHKVSSDSLQQFSEKKAMSLPCSNG